MLDKYSRFILAFLDKSKNYLSTKHERVFLCENYQPLIQKASENRISFYFIKKVAAKHPELIKELGLSKELAVGKEKWNKVFRTQKYLSKFSEDFDFLFFKSMYGFPAVTSDIDILFSNNPKFHSFIELMRRNNFCYVEDEKFKGSLCKNGYLKIEPHLDISWYDRKFIDLEFIFENYEYKEVNNRKVKIPNNDSCLLISLAHIIFDCQYIVLRDFIKLREILKEVSSTTEIRKQSVKYGWEEAFDYLLKLIKDIDVDIKKGRQGKEYSFPIWLPFTIYMSFFAKKFFFDMRYKKTAFTLQNLIYPVLSYPWKRTRMKFSRKIYRHSWLY